MIDRGEIFHFVKKYSWGLVLVLVIADQLTKQYALTHSFAVYNISSALELIPSIESLPLFIILLLIIIVWLKHEEKITTLSFILIMSGGLSNLLDRFFRVGVVDWIPIPGTGLYNNMADWMITLGCIILIGQLIYENRHSHSL